MLCLVVINASPSTSFYLHSVKTETTFTQNLDIPNWICKMRCADPVNNFPYFHSRASWTFLTVSSSSRLTFKVACNSSLHKRTLIGHSHFPSKDRLFSPNHTTVPYKCSELKWRVLHTYGNDKPFLAYSKFPS